MEEHRSKRGSSKRARNSITYDNLDLGIGLGEDDDTDYKPTQSQAPNKAATKAIYEKLPSKASILILAHTDDVKDENLSHVDENIIARIIKALNLANHSGTGEQEAKAALRMANKLMAYHSVSQADILSRTKDDKEKLEKAGMSTVTIRSHDNKKTMRISSWSMIAAGAINIFFNCKSYTESFPNDSRVDFVFYGLAGHTVAAAYAFEMVYNLILTWRMLNKEAKGLHAKNAYCHGIADGLKDFAIQEEQKEEREVREKEKRRLEAAQKAETEERKKQVQRLDHPDKSIKTEEFENIKLKVEEIDESVNAEKNDGSHRVKIEDADDEQKTILSPPLVQPCRRSEPADALHEKSEPESPIDVDFDAFVDADFNDDEDTNAWIDTSSSDFIRVSNQHSTADGKVEERDDEKSFKVEEHDVKGNIGDSLQVLDEETPWGSTGQLVAFRKSALTIADEFLKKEHADVKVVKRRESGLVLREPGADKSYQRGREDAKKIDVKRRRITETEEDFVY